MAPSIIEILEGIESRLATIPGLRTSEIVPDQVNPPIAVVGVPPISNYHATMGRGKFALEPTVTVIVSSAMDRSGQRALAEYANPTGDKSIVAAIEGDKTLGGVVDDCIVVSFDPLGLESVGAVDYYGGLFTLRVVASGV
ncbi:hypothetical protein [Microbispora bryophytorum]|uniref:hypothetical protein n=1 Tax=Microbispora bryophytorum TaxID=1460882 RepID=UPI0033EC3E00